METFRRLFLAAAVVALVACQPGGSDSSGSALASGSALPSGSPAGVDGEQLIGAFFELVTSDDFSARTEMTGTLTVGSLQLGLRATGSLSGGDGSMALKLNTVSAKIEFEVIFVGDYGYVRLPGGEWQRLPRDQVDTSGAQLDAFEFLTSADDLAYDGTTTRDGEELYVLVNSRPLVLEGSGAAAEGAAGEMTRLQILVRPDGTPVYLSYHMTVTSTDASAPLVAIKGDIQQSFTDVGEPIVIEPPASFTK